MTKGRPACLSSEEAIQGRIRETLQFIHLSAGTSFVSKLATIQTEMQNCLQPSKVPVLHEYIITLFSFLSFTNLDIWPSLSFLVCCESPPVTWKALNSVGVHEAASCDGQFGSNTLL